MNKLQQWLAGALGIAAKAEVPLSRVRWSAYGTHAGSDANKFSDTPAGWINAAHANVWARNSIRARASAVAQTPMRLYQYDEKTGEETEVTEHEVLDLLEKVNPINSNKSSFRRMIETQLSIHGDCIVVKVRGLERVRELYVLPRQLCIPEPDDNKFIAGYRWLVTGELIPPENVIRFWYPSPDGSIDAESPTSTALRYINPYGVADISAEAIDRRGGQGGGIVSYDALSNNIDIERMKSEWERKYSDPRNAGVDKHMPPGTRYESGALTAQQMQREERMMRLAHNIMACYFVPPANAGDMSDASVLANAAMQSKTFWELFALDELDFVAEVFNNELLWREWPGSYESGLYFKHDVSQVAALSEDADAKMNRAVVGVQGSIISINEGRDLIGMEPVEDDPQADQVTFTVEQKPQSTPGAGELIAPEVPSAKAFPMEQRNGVMIGFFLSTHDARRIVPADNELPPNARREETLHLTLAFLGKIQDLEPQRQEITSVVDTFAASHSPMAGHVQGIGKFNGVEDGESDCIYASYDAVNLAQFRTELVAALASAGIPVAMDHGFVPHIALAYIPRSDAIPDMTMPDAPMTFAALTLTWGNEHHVVPLSAGHPVPAADATLPVIDFVGMKALTPDGAGQIESIHRFGEHGGLTATKAAPVVIVAGKAYPAGSVKVVLTEVTNGE